MTSTTLDQIVERVGTLPQVPGTVLRLMNIVSDPNASLKQIVDVIRYDQALTAEVLRLCNSAYFGLARKVESLDDAVSLLGTVKVFQLVMAAHARVMLNRPQEGYGMRAGALWQHSVGVAVATQLLARRMHLTHTGLLFTAGLLHDTGKIVLNELVHEEYNEIVRRVMEEGASFSEAEEQVLGCTHAMVGGRLAEKWSLPESIVRCIVHHHDPEALEEVDPAVDAVHLADSVCLMLGLGLGDDGLSYRVSPAVLARYNMSESDLEAIGVEVIGELRSVQDLLAKP